MSLAFHTSDNVPGWMNYFLEVSILSVLTCQWYADLTKHPLFFNFNFVVPNFPLDTLMSGSNEVKLLKCIATLESLGLGALGAK